MEENTPIYEPSTTGALRQGEILSNLLQAKLTLESLTNSEQQLIVLTHPFSIVMSQDCDLDWDFRARMGPAAESKLMPNVLFCEMIEAHALRGVEGINSTVWRRIKINKDERYQFLQRILAEQDAQDAGLPELAIDFKRYFTLPTDEVYKHLELGVLRRSRLRSPYVEHLSSRFGFYQSRVALPSEHESEPT